MPEKHEVPQFVIDGIDYLHQQDKKKILEHLKSRPDVEDQIKIMAGIVDVSRKYREHLQKMVAEITGGDQPAREPLDQPEPDAASPVANEPASAAPVEKRLEDYKKKMIGRLNSPNINGPIFKEILTNLGLRKGIHMREIAAKAGVSESYLFKIFRMEKPDTPTFNKLVEWAIKEFKELQ